MPKVYDAKDDAFREATQEDVDVLQACTSAYGQLREIFFHPDGTPKRFLQTGDTLFDEEYYIEDGLEAARVVHQKFRNQVKMIREKKDEA